MPVENRYFGGLSKKLLQSKNAKLNFLTFGYSVAKGLAKGSPINKPSPGILTDFQ